MEMLFSSIQALPLMIWARLMKEMENNISIQASPFPLLSEYGAYETVKAIWRISDSQGQYGLC